MDWFLCVECFASAKICSQLRYDGFETVATNLAKSIAGSLAACSSSSRLAHLVDLGLKTDEEREQTPKNSSIYPGTSGGGPF